MTEQRYQPWKIVVDILCYALVFLPRVCLKYAGIPAQRGFFCDDESISHPYSESTVTALTVFIVGFGLPVIIFLICEGVLHLKQQKNGRPNPPYKIGKKTVPFLVYQYYKIIGIFMMGGAFIESFVATCKYTTGKLRPHFLDVCRPDYSQFNCTDVAGHPVLVQGDYCKGTDEDKMLEMRLSFPSGHAAFSVFAMVYLALYLQARVTWRGVRMVRALLQCVALMMAAYCSLSRVADYKHHGSDVLAGAVCGVTVAYVSAFHFSGLFKMKKSAKIGDIPYQMEGMNNPGARPSVRDSNVTDDETGDGEYYKNNNI